MCFDVFRRCCSKLLILPQGRVGLVAPSCRSLSVQIRQIMASPIDYDTYTYLAITLTPSSPVLADPSRVHPHLKHLGPVCHYFLPHLIRSRSCNTGRPEHCPTSMCSRCQSEHGCTHPQPSSRDCVRQTVFKGLTCKNRG